jgi:hypothetical protein
MTGTTTDTDTYDTEMNLGRAALAAGDFRTAYGRAAKQLLLLAATPVFNRNTRPRRPAVANGGGAKRWN